MSKRFLALFLALCLTLAVSGCAPSRTEEPANLAWHEEFDRTAAERRYTVLCITTPQGSSASVREWFGSYDGVRAHTLSSGDTEDPELYYETDGDSSTLYFYNAEYEVWVKTDTDYDENLLSAVTVMDRLRKYGGWIDRGELVFDPEENLYRGRDLSGNYLCGDTVHRVTALDIGMQDGRVLSVKETYEIDDGEGGTAGFVDTVTFDCLGYNTVILPERALTPEEIEEWVQAIRAGYEPTEPQPTEEEPDDDWSDDDWSDEEPTEEEPSDEQPTEEEPSDEQPAEEEPSDEQPAEEEPSDEQPAEEEPPDEQPAEEEPSDEQPAQN